MTTTVLVVSTCPWIGRAIDAAVSEDGHAMIRAVSFDDATRLLQTEGVDGVVFDEQIADRAHGDRDPDLLAMLAAARADRDIPVVVLTHEPVQASRVAALSDLGVWGVVPFPFGATAWARQLGVWVRASHRMRHRVVAGLVDPVTGLYNHEGIVRRGAEIDGEVRRRGGAVGCAIFGPARDDAALTDAIADACRQGGRAGDAFGRIGGGEFAVIAPDADLEGVHALVRRLADAVEARLDRAAALRVGACGVVDLNAATLTVADMLAYAASRRAPLYGVAM